MINGVIKEKSESTKEKIMKKILMISIVLLLSVSLFAAVSATGTVAGLSGDGGAAKDATLDYTLSLDDTDTFKIGFSTNVIKTLNDVPADASAIALKPVNGAFTATDNTVYVYWQILSPSACKIYLEATSLIKDNSSVDVGESEYIPLSISTAVGGEKGDNGIAVGTATSTTGKNNAAFTRIGGDSANLFEFETTTTYTDHQAAGSQQLTVTTGNFADKAAGDYTAHLKLTIASGN